jgi:hypothetical protein
MAIAHPGQSGTSDTTENDQVTLTLKKPDHSPEGVGETATAK